MGKLYLPYASQFDLMNENLAKIVKAIGLQVDISTWGGIQKAVRAGIAADVLPVGTQLLVSNGTYGDKLYDVVAHNRFKSVHDENAPTMTLMSHDILAKVQFDAPEAFYYADEVLGAGTYHFTLATSYASWLAGTYQFTLTQDVPVGGQLCISGNADTAMTSLSVKSFASRTATTETEMVSITSGSDGESLGAFGNELNHLHRVSYGSNNYKESAIRQFLNSPSAAGSVWKPQTKFDRPPSWATSLAGFMSGFDADFLSVVGEAFVPCAANGKYETPDSTTAANGKYTVRDKFYLASLTEICGVTTDTPTDESYLLPYYNGADDADRSKYMGDSAVAWWTRSAHSWTASDARSITSMGTPLQARAREVLGIAPVCNIV